MLLGSKTVPAAGMRSKPARVRRVSMWLRRMKRASFCESHAVCHDARAVRGLDHQEVVIAAGGVREASAARARRSAISMRGRSRDSVPEAAAVFGVAVRELK